MVMQDGWPDPALTENDLDVMLAAEKKRQPELCETFVRSGTVTVFDALWVQILAGDNQVYSIGHQDEYEKTNDSRVLGPLNGAEAHVTDATSSFSLGKMGRRARPHRLSDPGLLAATGERTSRQR
jgi:hypothetical protein